MYVKIKSLFILFLILFYQTVSAQDIDFKNICQAYLVEDFDYISKYVALCKFETIYEPKSYISGEPVFNYIKISKLNYAAEQVAEIYKTAKGNIIIDLLHYIDNDNPSKNLEQWKIDMIYEVMNPLSSITFGATGESEFCRNNRKNMFLRTQVVMPAGGNIETLICNNNGYSGLKSPDNCSYYGVLDNDGHNISIETSTTKGYRRHNVQGSFSEYLLAKYYELPVLRNWISIPCQYQNGHAFISIDINGTKKEYLIDTGASYFSIDNATAKELILTGDAQMLETYAELELANGTKVKAKKIVIKRMKIGNYSVENVLAVIVNPDPKLMGMSVLNKFSKWYFDSAANSLMVLTK